ncbi:hypothetical protein C8J57DRAFT_446135 [Mycena rebaudengoi]|nr:hypothetical protein C8J57DRAFT_446135 [Mycena rebaudengoi]
MTTFLRWGSSFSWGRGYIWQPGAQICVVFDLALSTEDSHLLLVLPLFCFGGLLYDAPPAQRALVVDGGGSCPPPACTTRTSGSRYSTGRWCESSISLPGIRNARSQSRGRPSPTYRVLGSARLLHRAVPGLRHLPPSAACHPRRVSILRVVVGGCTDASIQHKYLPSAAPWCGRRSRRRRRP